MQVFTPAIGSWWKTRASRQNGKEARSGRIALVLARFAKRVLRTEDDFAHRYSGCGWGDETERRLLGDVLDGRYDGLFR